MEDLKMNNSEKPKVLAFVTPYKKTLKDVGWGCGYVAIDKNNLLHGISIYEENNDDYERLDDYISAHGGITFSDWASSIYENKEKFESIEMLSGNKEELKENIGDSEELWVIGFDTAHYMDTISHPTKEHVIKWTMELVKEVEQYCASNYCQECLLNINAMFKTLRSIKSGIYSNANNPNLSKVRTDTMLTSIRLYDLEKLYKRFNIVYKGNFYTKRE